MSTYTYECKYCGEFDITIPHTKLPLLYCPFCSSMEINRIWNIPQMKCPGGFGKSSDYNNNKIKR